MDTGTLALILFGMFALLLIMKVPVSFCLGIAATVCLIILGYPLTVISQKIFTALNSFSIMAIPLFILGGNLMSEGGISKRLTEFCEALVGNIRGGLAIVVILACAFFAALSGSGPATVIAIGSMMYPEMVKRGYPDYQVAGLVAVARRSRPDHPAEHYHGRLLHHDPGECCQPFLLRLPGRRAADHRDGNHRFCAGEEV